MGPQSCEPMTLGSKLPKWTSISRSPKHICCGLHLKNVNLKANVDRSSQACARLGGPRRAPKAAIRCVTGLCRRPAQYNASHRSRSPQKDARVHNAVLYVLRPADPGSGWQSAVTYAQISPAEVTMNGHVKLT